MSATLATADIFPKAKKIALEKIKLIKEMDSIERENGDVPILKSQTLTFEDVKKLSNEIGNKYKGEKIDSLEARISELESKFMYTKKIEELEKEIKRLNRLVETLRYEYKELDESYIDLETTNNALIVKYRTPTSLDNKI